ALMQGYDAFALECDVQVGGTEQLFNLMAGRKIQEDAGQKPHVPVTLPILVGLDGKARMSKSAGNHIGVSDSPDDQYGKVMSLPDDVLESFFVLATNVERSRIPEIMADAPAHPMETKKLLARTIVSEFHGEAAADAAEERFERTVQRKELLDEDFRPARSLPGEPLSAFLVRIKAVESRRQVNRLVAEGAIRREVRVMTGHPFPARWLGAVTDARDPVLRDGGRWVQGLICK